MIILWHVLRQCLWIRLLDRVEARRTRNWGPKAAGRYCGKGEADGERSDLSACCAISLPIADCNLQCKLLTERSRSVQSELRINAGASAFQLRRLLKSDKIWCQYLLPNCVSVRELSEWSSYVHDVSLRLTSCAGCLFITVTVLSVGVIDGRPALDSCWPCINCLSESTSPPPFLFPSATFSFPVTYIFLGRSWSDTLKLPFPFAAPLRPVRWSRGGTKVSPLGSGAESWSRSHFALWYAQNTCLFAAVIEVGYR